MNEQTKFGRLLSLIDKIVEKERDYSRNVKILIYFEKLANIYSSSFGNMLKSNLKEEKKLVEENSPVFMTKATKGIRKKIGKKTHGVKWKIPSATKKVRIKL